MDWYDYIFLGAAVAQLLSLINTYRNYRYALTKEQRRPNAYASNTVLVVPCKGLDDNFQRNIESFYALDFEPYSLWFVVEDPKAPPNPLTTAESSRRSNPPTGRSSRSPSSLRSSPFSPGSPIGRR